MSMSISYSVLKEYFHDVLQFLSDYKWIYNTSNTQFIAEGILEQIPTEWINFLSQLTNDELNNLPFECFNESWPSNFKHFLLRLRKLRPNIEVSLPLSHQESVLNKLVTIKGINPKKQHEIIQLSQEIYNICGTQIDTLIDIGSGLGYLSQTLNYQFKYKLLGLESCTDRVQTAKHRQQKYYPDSTNSVKYAKHFIDLFSDEFINSELSHYFPESKRFAIIGLHACADLSIAAIKLFLSMDNVEKLIIMPCCYHKMCMKNGDENEFENVPISQLMKDLLIDCDCRSLINIPFLRLGSQQTAARWKNQTEDEHKKHGENMFYRAALDMALDKDEIIFKEKCTPSKLDTKTSFLNTEFELLTQKYGIRSLTSGNCKQWSAAHEKRFKCVLEKYPNGAFLSEILTGFQAMIQSLCENIILLDRVCYIGEESKKHMKISKRVCRVKLKKIMLESLSPRCMVLIAEKDNS